jgi:hypothetical protein
VLDYIRRYKPRRILELGSGAKGIGEFCKKEFTGVDVSLDEPPVQNMTFVQSSASKLPFADASFDLVVCMDVLEHMSAGERERMVGEMVRVAGIDKGNRGEKGNQGDKGRKICRDALLRVSPTVIVGYPCGEGAEKLSKKMLAWFEARGSGTARWFEEHSKFGLPNLNFKFSILNFKKNSICEFNNENLFICEWLLKFEDNPRFLKLERFLFANFRPLVEFLLRHINYGECYRKIWFLRIHTLCVLILGFKLL